MREVDLTELDRLIEESAGQVRGGAWTPAEDEILFRCVIQGRLPYRTVALKLGRTHGALDSRLKRLKVSLGIL